MRTASDTGSFRYGKLFRTPFPFFIEYAFEFHHFFFLSWS